MRRLKALTRTRLFRQRPTWRLWNSSTLTQQVVLIAVSLSLVQSALFGFYPGRVNLKRGRFFFSFPVAVYCFSVWTALGVFYGSRIWKAYAEEEIYLRDPIQIFSYMSIVLALLNYVSSWITFSDMLHFLNKVPLMSTIRYFGVPIREVSRFLLLAILKQIGCPLIMHWTLILYQCHADRKPNLMKSNITMMPVYISNHPIDCFFGSILLARTVLLEINKRVHEIMVQVNRLQTPVELLLQKPYYRMQRFCDLADLLDELAYKYKITTEYAVEVMELFAFAVVGSMAIALTGTTIGFYTQYQSIADHIMLEEPYDVYKAVTNFVFLAVPVFNLYLIASISQQLVDEAKETGNVLQRINLDHADVRFKQVVEAFWLVVNTVKLKLTPMGLLQLNGSLTSMVLATVAGFLLFLIQNDLTRRFSLK